jgi:serine/threonine-protein kinase
MTHQANDHTGREARVNAAIADYFNAVDSGQTPDHAAFLRQHADLAPELEAFFSDQERLGALFPPTPGGSLASTGPDLSPRQPATVPEAGVLSTAEAPTLPSWAGRLQIVAPIGHGGMGEVYHVRDSDFGRDLAVKILQPELLDRPAMVERFLEEARICGRLQHPGVPPVHEMGRLPDGRPYFTMKLVRGRTLAELLRERDDFKPRFLKVFEQICQTVAYAHSQGIIHRDLKPANVMVGAFGEVQVMDWGLAKVLAEDAGQDVGQAFQPDRPGSVRLENLTYGRDVTHPGDVLGTFAYMPPEQARGDINRLDERCDVFSLGALLCQVLTGRPPYTGTDKASLWEKARRADLAEGFARLDGCGADGELTGLAKRCLSADSAGRPHNAGEVARAVAAHLAAVEERARKAEVERAAAEARAAEAKAKAQAERRARRLAVGLAAAVLLTVLAGGGGWLWLVQDRAARERSANLALGKAEQLMDQAKEVDPETVAAAEQAVVLWRQASDLLDQAVGVLGSGFGAEAARERLAEQRREVEAGLSHAEAVAKLLADLDKARALRSNWRGSHFDYESADRCYADAVATYGLDVYGPAPEEVAAAIRKERPAVRLALVVALDDWAFCARDQVRAPRLRQVADLADDDDWRHRYRAAAIGGDLGELKRLAEESRGQSLPAASLGLLASALWKREARAEAAAMLRQARGKHPTDFWIHYELGSCLHDPVHPDLATLDEALGCFWAAVALRPGSAPAHNNLGLALKDKGLVDEAIAQYHKAIEIDPQLAYAHTNLGLALEAKGQLDEAIAEYHKAIEIDPQLARAHNNLGLALKAKGRLDQAIVEWRKAIEIDPKLAPAHYNLGVALKAKGRLDDAIAEYHKATDLDPKYATALGSLGITLSDKGRLDEAITAFQKVIELDAKSAPAHYNLGNALKNKGRLDQAIAAFHKAIDLDPKLVPAHFQLGNALAAKGRTDDAIAEYHKVIDLDPRDATAHYNLGNALMAEGLLDESIAEFRQAIKFQPGYAEAHCNLGHALRQHGDFAEALAALKRGHELGTKRKDWRYPSAEWVKQCERLLALDEKLRAILKGAAKPADAQENAQLGDLCLRYRKRYVAAVGFFADAFAADPKLADDLRSEDRYNAACSAALAAAGKGDDTAKLDDKERARLRQQALTWLHADLTAWGKLLEQQPDKARPAVLKTMQHWQQDTDFTNVRGDALAKLPEAERNEWRKLWEDVAELLKKAQEKK